MKLPLATDPGEPKRSTQLIKNHQIQITSYLGRDQHLQPLHKTRKLHFTHQLQHPYKNSKKLSWISTRESVKLLSSVASLIFRMHQSKKSSAAPELGGFCFSHLKVREPGASRCYPTDSQNDLLVGKVHLQKKQPESCQVQKAPLLPSCNWRTVCPRMDF